MLVKGIGNEKCLVERRFRPVIARYYRRITMRELGVWNRSAGKRDNLGGGGAEVAPERGGRVPPS
jgi:hypothetical protein